MTEILHTVFTGSSRNLNLVILSVLLVSTHVGGWLYVERIRDRVERTTRIIFQRGLLLVLTTSTVTLLASVLYPEISGSIGFCVTVALIVISTILHSLIRMSQTGLERTPGYVAGLASIFVVVMILPALFVSELPFVVYSAVLALAASVATASVTSSLISLRRISHGPPDALSSFRARRIVRVLGWSLGVSTILLVCSPFMLYATPVESISAVMCSSFVCISGVHVATERVGFLVDYARTHVPQLEHMSPVELERVSLLALNSARLLVHTPPDNENYQFSSRVRHGIGTLLPETERVISSESGSGEEAVLKKILAHTEVEDKLFQALLQVGVEERGAFSYRDFTELIKPHVELSKKLVGDEVAGISEETMFTLSQIISEADTKDPVLLLGEQGVGKHFYASLLGKVKGISEIDTHTFDSESADFWIEIEALRAEAILSGRRSLAIVKIKNNPGRLSESQSVQKILPYSNGIDLIITLDGKSRGSHTPSMQIGDSIVAPQIIELRSLRERTQDIVCQTLWFLFDAAAEFVSENDLQRLRISHKAILESLTYPWLGNSAELKDSVRAALYIARRNASLELSSIVAFDRVGSEYRLATWLEEGLRSFLPGVITDLSDAPNLAHELHVSLDFATRVINATISSAKVFGV